MLKFLKQFILNKQNENDLFYDIVYFSRQYQYFRVNAGVVTVKTASDAPEVEIPVFRPRARFSDGMPPVIPAAGLSGQRQQKAICISP